MAGHHRAGLVLAATLTLAVSHGAEAGWKRTTLVANVPGQLTTVALADNGQALTGFLPAGWTIGLGAWAAKNYFLAFGYCGASGSTIPTATDNQGNDVGTCFNTTGNTGYVHNSTGAVSAISIQGAPDTYAAGVLGTIVVGTYRSTNQSHVYHGYLLVTNENGYKDIDPPASINTFVNGIDGLGDIWGSYFDTAGLQHAFIDWGGNIATVDLPGRDLTAVAGVSFNKYSGTAYSNGVGTAFLVSDALHYLPLSNVKWSQALAMNATGVIVGTFVSTTGIQAGFRWDGANNTVRVIQAPAGSTGFIVNAINASGEIAGVYTSGGQAVSFVATCTAQSCS